MTNLYLYVMNDETLYRRFEIMVECIAKRKNAGKPVEINYLAQSSIMTKLICEASKYARRCGDTVTREERNAARVEIAEAVFSDVDEL